MDDGRESSVDSGTGGGENRRIMIVAAEAAVGESLIDRLGSRLDGSNVEILIVSPALAGSAFKHAMGDVDDAREDAGERLEESFRHLSRAGLEVNGQVGDSDPVLAIEDALATFPADEIVLVTRPDDEARWLEGDLFDRARQKFEAEIVHISLERTGEDAGEVTDVEGSGQGVDAAPDKEVSPKSRNLPRFSVRDIVGIAVALIGTLILVVLAADCEAGNTALQRSSGTGGAGSDGGCVARTIIAGATALINIAHVVGLMLFESVGYRGGWARGFALLSLVGTPVAIIASLVVH